MDRVSDIVLVAKVVNHMASKLQTLKEVCLECSGRTNVKSFIND